MARNWDRREAISIAVKPAPRSRSKPRGVEMVDVCGKSLPQTTLLSYSVVDGPFNEIVVESARSISA